MKIYLSIFLCSISLLFASCRVFIEEPDCIPKLNFYGSTWYIESYSKDAVLSMDTIQKYYNNYEVVYYRLKDSLAAYGYYQQVYTLNGITQIVPLGNKAPCLERYPNGNISLYDFLRNDINTPHSPFEGITHFKVLESDDFRISFKSMGGESTHIITMRRKV